MKRILVILLMVGLVAIGGTGVAAADGPSDGDGENEEGDDDRLLPPDRGGGSPSIECVVEPTNKTIKITFEAFFKIPENAPIDCDLRG